MYVTLRMPASAARQLNLGVDDEQEEVTARLTPMELAGRLTVTTGMVVAPEGVIEYCRAWAAARAASQGLVDKYGLAVLVETLRATFNELLLWLPEDDQDIVSWLRVALEVHLLQSALGAKLKPKAAYVWGYQLTANRVADYCQARFSELYSLWVRIENAQVLRRT